MAGEMSVKPWSVLDWIGQQFDETYHSLGG
jgi:hypothetical protein